MFVNNWEESGSYNLVSVNFSILKGNITSNEQTIMNTSKYIIEKVVLEIWETHIN